MKKISHIIFYLILLVLPFNARHIFNYEEISHWEGFRENIAWSFYFFDGLILLLLILWLIDFCRRKKGKVFREKSFFSKGFLKTKENILAWFVFFALLASFLALEQNVSGYAFLRLLEGVVFFLLASDFLKNRKLFKISVLVIFFGGVIQSGLALIQFVWQKSMGLGFLGESVIGPQILGVAKFELAGEKMIRAYGTFPHPNLLGAFLLLSLAAGIWLFVFFKKKDWRAKKNVLISSGLVFVLFGIFLSYSRSVIGVTMIFALVMGISYWRNVVGGCNQAFQKLKIPLFLRGAVAIFFVFYFIFIVYNILLPRLCWDECYNDDSFNLRKIYLGYSGEAIVEHPWLGVGPGNYLFFLREKVNGKLPDWDLQPVHNLYFLVSSELGLVGLVFFLLFLFTLIYAYMRVKGFRHWVRDPLAVAVLLFFFLGLVDHYFWTLPQGQMLFWLALSFLEIKKD